MKSRINKYILIGFFLVVALFVAFGASPAYAADCPSYGGITLDKAATFLSSMKDIQGVTYNPVTNQLILIGHDNASLPAMNADDVAVAIRSVMSGNNPSFTFGLDRSKWVNGQVPATYYPDETLKKDVIKNTHFGNVLFESDRILKILVNGRDNVPPYQTVSPGVPGYKSVLNRYIALLDAANVAPPSGDWFQRWWFHPGNMVLVKSPDGKTFKFSEATMVASTEAVSGSNPYIVQASEDFVNNLTVNYDSYANRYPVLHQLKQLAKITAVVKWIHDNNVPLDMTFWNQYQIAYEATPSSTPLETVLGSYTTSDGTPHNVGIEGGVDLSGVNTYLDSSPAAAALGQAAVTSQPSDHSTAGWTFTDQTTGTTYNAVALSLGPSLLPGACTEEAKDVSMPTRGALPLEFTRRYSSTEATAHPTRTSMGYGWTAAPAQINFPTDVYKSNYTNGSGQNQTVYKQLAVTLSGKREAFGPSVFILPNAIAYAPTDEKVHDRLVANEDGTYKLEVDAIGKNQNGPGYYLASPTSTYTFNAQGKLTEHTDRNGNAIQYAYGSNGLLSSMSDPAGRHITISYDASNRVSQVTDPLGQKRYYAYDPYTGNLSSFTDAGGNTWTYVYDDGNEWPNGYSNHLLTSITDPDGTALWTKSYDELGRVTDASFADGTSKAINYNDQNHVLTSVDGVSNTTTSQYDKDGQLLSKTDPLGNTTSYTYDPTSANPKTVTDPKGGTTTFTLDQYGFGHPTAVQDPNGNTVTIRWDSSNNWVNGFTDPRGFNTNFTYDPKGNLTKKEEAYTNEITLYGRDEYGQMISKTDPNDHTTNYTYDSFGDLTSTTDPLGNRTTYAYSANGQPTSLTDPGGGVTSFSYDPLGNLLQVSDALGGNTTYTYNKEGKRTSETDANGHKTMYTFNPAGQLTAKADPLGNQTTYTYYYAQNLLASETTAAGDTIYDYDANGNPTLVYYPDGSQVQNSYDPNGQLVQIVDASGTTTFAYDAVGRLREKTVNGENARLSYDRDENGNVTGFTLRKNDATTEDIQYQYDGLNRMTQLAEGLGTTYTFQYDLSGNLTGASFPNSGGRSYTYDAADRLTDVKVTGAGGSVLSKNKTLGQTQTLDEHGYQYDANGNRTVETLASGNQNQYAYDALNRLVSEKVNVDSGGNPTTATYEYQRGFDPAGNNTSLAFTSYTQQRAGLLGGALGKQSLTPTTNNYSYQYNAANQVTSLNGSPNNYAETYVYNSLGQLTSKNTPGGATSFTYDGAGDLTGISGPHGQESFTYNGYNQRVSGTTPSGTVNYLWSGEVVVNATSSGSSDYDYLYTYGPGGLLAKNSGGARTYYGVDGRANVTDTQDDTAREQNTYSYSAFGVFLSKNENSDPESQTFVGAQGVQLDNASGLYYMGHRWYDPYLGRFISQDPFPAELKDPQSLNRYAYVKNNPLIYTDPLGLYTDPELGYIPDSVFSETCGGYNFASDQAIIRRAQERRAFRNEIFDWAGSYYLEGVQAAAYATGELAWWTRLGPIGVPLWLLANPDVAYGYQ